MSEPVYCPYCGFPAKLVTGETIYPRLRRLHSLHFWSCGPCGAYVGTHKNSKKHTPLGRLANAELRAAKVGAHDAFDPLWKTGEMSRAQAYSWLSKALGMERHLCHIGMFDVDDCERVVQACRAREESPCES